MFNKNKPQEPDGNKIRTFAFIDSQNLNLGTQRMGWKLDWRKFRSYLQDDYGVSKAYTFIGYMAENEQLYEYMHELGYLVVLKKTISSNASANQNTTDNNQTKKEDKASIKGNVDTELVLYAMKEMPNYDKAIIVSGDGDFHSLIEYLEGQNKLDKVMTPNWQYSSLLKDFDSKIVRLDKLRKRLEYKDRSRSKK